MAACWASEGPTCPLVARMAVQHAIVSDEAVAALGQKHLVPNSIGCQALPRWMRSMWGSKSEKSFSCTGTGSSWRTRRRVCAITRSARPPKCSISVLRALTAAAHPGDVPPAVAPQGVHAGLVPAVGGREHRGGRPRGRGSADFPDHAWGAAARRRVSSTVRSKPCQLSCAPMT